MKAKAFLLNAVSLSKLLTLSCVLLSLAIAVACGTGQSREQTPAFSGSTDVTVLFSSEANDQLMEFDIGFTGIELTSQSGKKVSVFSEPQGSELTAEFIHVNGGLDPFITVSVPQGIYTAARVTVAQSGFSCAALTPDGGLDTSTFAYGFSPTSAPATTVTVNLPAPITITGTSMGLRFDLAAAQSATYQSCFGQGIQPYTITPTFTLTPVSFAMQPTNANNGEVTGMNGEVSAINGNSQFTLTLSEVPRTVSVNVSNSTNYQGISNFSALTVGTFLTMDGAVQSDGSLLATDIAVPDTAAAQLQAGPILQTSFAAPLLWMWGREQLGTGVKVLGAQPFSLINATFGISGDATNLQSLPFVPSFNSSSMVPGQNVNVTATTLTGSGGFPYTPGSTVTLMPQTINGTVAASTANGNFTQYSVTLATDDLFPALAVQQGQPTLLNNPSQVEVYLDSSTQMLNTQPIGPGATFRFHGLMFDDSGTLRMDCIQVNDGVTSSSTPNTQSGIGTHASETLKRQSNGSIQHTLTSVAAPAQR